MLRLVPLSAEDGHDIYEMLQQIAPDDNGFHNKVCGMSYQDFRAWLAREYGCDQGELEDWMVPQSSYWLYDGASPVGYGRIRHRLNDHLRETSGHIGYAVPRSQRGKGYGTELLRLLLKECAGLGIHEVQISANEDNLLSNRVIVRNGGKNPRKGGGKLFYTISLQG